MPTYEYECKTCGTVFDVFQSIKARPLKQHQCPDCGRMRVVLRRIGSGGAVLFKGSGFYTTDYRGDQYKKAAKAESESGKPASDGKISPSDTEKKTTTTSNEKSSDVKPAASDSKSSKKKK